MLHINLHILYIPDPLGKPVTTTTTVDANFDHCLATGRSLMGCLDFVNHTPIDLTQKGKQQWKLLHMDQNV